MKNVMTFISLWFNRMVNLIMKIALAVSAVLLVIMTVSTIGQVVCRFTHLFTFETSEEIARYSMCWLAMLGSAVALRQGRHIGVRVIVDRLPAGMYDKWLCPIIQLVMLAFFILVTVKGWEYAMKGGRQMSPALYIPMMYPYLALPVGGFIMALNVISDMLQDHFPTEAGSNASIATTVMEDMSEVEAEAEAGAQIFDPLHDSADDENGGRS